MNNYTTKTASIRATIGDIRKLDSRVIDSKEIKLDGTDIKDLWGFQDSEDFKKLVKRCELPEGSNYILWTDTGQVAYMSFADRLTNGTSMFYQSALTSWDIDLPSLTNGEHMFSRSDLQSFNGDLSSLTNGHSMFWATDLTSWDIDLPSLTDGGSMFNHTYLTSWDIDLPSLTNGDHMFYSSALESFNGDLSNLTDGSSMFRDTPIESFSGDLSSLTDGEQMFYRTALASFNSDLSSLTNGYWMFWSCKLDLTSVQNIASTINTVSGSGKIIMLGVQSSLQGNTELETAINAIKAKGWIPFTQYNA